MFPIETKRKLSKLYEIENIGRNLDHRDVANLSMGTFQKNKQESFHIERRHNDGYFLLKDSAR